MFEVSFTFTGIICIICIIIISISIIYYYIIKLRIKDRIIKNLQETLEKQQAIILDYENHKKAREEYILSLCCSICLDNVNSFDDILSVTRCNHIFHKTCLNKWSKNNNNCPNCRVKL
jgi:hypothetical protein